MIGAKIFIYRPLSNLIISFYSFSKFSSIDSNIKKFEDFQWRQIRIFKFTYLRQTQKTIHKRQFTQILSPTAVIKISLFPRCNKFITKFVKVSRVEEFAQIHARLGSTIRETISPNWRGKKGSFCAKTLRDWGIREDSHRELSRMKRDAKTSGMRDVIRRKTDPDAVCIYNYECNRDLLSQSSFPNNIFLPFLSSLRAPFDWIFN